MGPNDDIGRGAADRADVGATEVGLRRSLIKRQNASMRPKVLFQQTMGLTGGVGTTKMGFLLYSGQNIAYGKFNPRLWLLPVQPSHCTGQKIAGGGVRVFCCMQNKIC